MVVFVWCLGMENLEAQTEDFPVTENSFFKSIRANQTDSYVTFSQGIGNVEPLGNINDASFFDLKERFNFSLTMAHRPKFLSDVSLFANF